MSTRDSGGRLTRRVHGLGCGMRIRGLTPQRPRRTMLSTFWVALPLALLLLDLCRLVLGSRGPWKQVQFAKGELP